MVDHGDKTDESETFVSEPSSSSSSAALAWDTHQQLIHPYFVNGTTSSVRNHWKRRTHPDSTTDDKTKI